MFLSISSESEEVIDNGERKCLLRSRSKVNIGQRLLRTEGKEEEKGQLPVPDEP